MSTDLLAYGDIPIMLSLFPYWSDEVILKASIVEVTERILAKLLLNHGLLCLLILATAACVLCR